MTDKPGARDFSQGAIKYFDIEDAPQAEDSQIGEDVQAAHPLHGRPDEATGDHGDADFGIFAVTAGELRIEHFGRDDEDQADGDKAKAGEQDVP